MNSVEIFRNEQFGELRAAEIDGTGWVVGKDVAEKLGYKDTVNALKNHVDEEDKLIWQIATSGQKRNMTMINESGLYSLVLSSKLPGAKAFKRWVTYEVLPSIRRNGSYTMKLPQDYPTALRELAIAVEENQTLKVQNLQMAPKIEFYNAVADSKDSIEMAHAAKLLAVKGFGRNKMFDFLRGKGVLDKNNISYQKYIDSGYFRVLEQKYTSCDGVTYICLKTLVYQKGLDYTRRLIQSS